MTTANPYSHCVEQLEVEGRQYKFYNLQKLEDPRLANLPFSIRVLLEAAVRNCDGFQVHEKDVQHILGWADSQGREEVPFKPARVILQDFTGVPAVVDFAAMRDAVTRLGGDASRINPVCPADLVIDHSVTVDAVRSVPCTPGGSAAAGRCTSGSCSAHKNRASVSAVARNLTCRRPVGSGRLGPRRAARASIEKGEKAAERVQSTDTAHNRLAPEDLRERSLRPQRASEPCASCHQSARAVPVTHVTCPFHAERTMGADALEKNQQLEFERNKERFQFLKWGARAFKNMQIVPPGSGIVHQVNLEYLARVVFVDPDGTMYPDSLVGTDSHTTMINGLGVLGWGVGGIEAEAVMLGQAISMLLPPVVGYKISGRLPDHATSTDAVLTITKHLRQVGVVGKFVEFFGPGVSELSIADRATISNMCPEYGATVGYFPVDEQSLVYLRQTGRDKAKLAALSAYLRASGLLRDFSNSAQDPHFSQVEQLDLASVVACCSGPKRPQDRVPVADMKRDFDACLSARQGFKGFGLADDQLQRTVPLTFEGQQFRLGHGSVVLAAITSCTNTSNPSVMLGAGLVAKRAVSKGLRVPPYVKTSLSPGSGVVTHYLQAGGVMPALQQLGFDIVGYGCMTCIGNSGPLPAEVAEAIEQGDLVAAGVLSGNRNFEGRIHPLTRANYLASPMLVVAYALAGTVCLDFEIEPLGMDESGSPVYLRDIWPSRQEIQELERQVVVPAMFRSVYANVQTGNAAWSALQAPEGLLYEWQSSSTYIKHPPFFAEMTREVPPLRGLQDAAVLLNLGDSVTTDHISPAGSIARNSPAARYLASRGLTPREFNSYGSRRGNDDVMSRGTFANIRLVNKLLKQAGPKTIHHPSGETMDIYDAASRYRDSGTPVIVLAGKEYGSGSSRDWAAKGPWILGVCAVLAESYERIHRSNLLGMGILPLQYLPGDSAAQLGLTGAERFSVELPQELLPGHELRVKLSTGLEFRVRARFDTEVELTYFRHGGILNYMVRKML